MRLRLKDLTKISGEVVDVPGVVSEVVGFRKKRFFNKYYFGIAIRKAMTLITVGRNLDLTTLSLSDDCKIKVPANIDNITFRAMVELQSVIGNSNEDSDVVDVMASVIAITCYSQNINDKYYDSECDAFKEFKERILNEPMEHMVGLYNYITETTRVSQLEWKKRFMSVEIESEDMRQAGVSALQQFTIINTIKTMCADFNCTYDGAWQMSYAVSQTNSYAKASTDHVHENLRILKEHKMKAQQKARKHS
jgi:hypothetical protein